MPTEDENAARLVERYGKHPREMTAAEFAEALRNAGEVPDDPDHPPIGVAGEAVPGQATVLFETASQTKDPHKASETG